MPADDPRRPRLRRAAALFHDGSERGADVRSERRDIVDEERPTVSGGLELAQLGDGERRRAADDEGSIRTALIVQRARHLFVLGPALTDDQYRRPIAGQTADGVEHARSCADRG